MVIIVDMGIKKELFVSDISVFLCVSCDEVALNPVLTSCCEAVYCSGCFNDSGNVCNGCSNVTTAMKLQKLLKTAYLGLELICDGCDELMAIEDRAGHNCAAKQFKCNSCGFDGQVSNEENHDCVDYLKNQVAGLVLDKNEDKRRLKQLEDDGDQFKAMFEQFMRKNGTIDIDKDGTVHVQINGADSLGRFRPKNVDVSTKPFEVIFNGRETGANQDIREKVTEIVLQVANSGINVRNHLIKVRTAMREQLGERWLIYNKKYYKQGSHGKIVPSSYCSFTFDGYQYIAFTTEKSKRQRAGRSGRGQSERKVVGSDDRGLETNQNEPVLNSKERGKVLAFISEVLNNGTSLNLVEVRSFLDQRLGQRWRVNTREQLLGGLPKKHHSFNLNGQEFIAYKTKARRGGRMKKCSKSNDTDDGKGSSVSGDVLPNGQQDVSNGIGVGRRRRRRANKNNVVA